MKTASGHGRKENRFLTFPHMFVKCFVLPAESNVFLLWFASPVSGAVVLYSQSQREQQPSQRAERRSKAASEATAGQHEKKKASKKVPFLQKPSLRINPSSPSSSICVAFGCLSRSLFYTSTMSYRKDNSNLHICIDVISICRFLNIHMYIYIYIKKSTYLFCVNINVYLYVYKCQPIYSSMIPMLSSVCRMKTNNKRRDKEETENLNSLPALPQPLSLNRPPRPIITRAVEP
jgi:hypothetical protein